MSLLMDALRKAERARREMAETGIEPVAPRSGDVAPVAAADEAGYPDLNDHGTVSGQPAMSDGPPMQPPAAADDGAQKALARPAELSLTLLENSALDQPLTIEPQPSTAGPAEPVAARVQAPNRDVAAPPASRAEADERAFEARPRAAPAEPRAPERPVHTTAPARNTQRQSPGAAEPEPAAARTRANAVFQSKRAVPPRSSRATRVMALSGVLLLLLVAGAGAYLYLMDDGGGLVPPGQVAYTPPPGDEPAPAGGGSDVVDRVAEPVLAGVAGANREPLPVNSMLRLTPESAIPATEGMPLFAPAPETMARAQVSAAPTGPVLAMPPAETRTAPAPAESAAVQVIRNVAANKIDGMLRAAWEAFMQGDLARARTGYQDALALDRMNRDGLLGLAAIEAAEGNPSAAAGYYRRLLERDPRDAAALEGMVALGGEAGVPDEQTLRSLGGGGKSGGALFALGNLYAAQQRWADAQAAWFDAHGRAPENPDYAFNLAISLEHLGQRQPALDYYRQALELARRRPHGFDLAQAQSRIEALLAQGGGDHGR